MKEFFQKYNVNELDGLIVFYIKHSQQLFFLFVAYIFCLPGVEF